MIKNISTYFNYIGYGPNSKLYKIIIKKLFIKYLKKTFVNIKKANFPERTTIVFVITESVTKQRY